MCYYYIAVYDTVTAGVAELADAQDLKSCGINFPYRFDSGLRHQEMTPLDLEKVGPQTI